jgi:hypothetical protein
VCLDEAAEEGKNVGLVAANFLLQRRERTLGQLTDNFQTGESLLAITRRRSSRKQSVGRAQSRCCLGCANRLERGNRWNGLVAGRVVKEGIQPAQFDLEVCAGHKDDHALSRLQTCKANSLSLRVAAVHDRGAIHGDASEGLTRDWWAVTPRRMLPSY